MGGISSPPPYDAAKNYWRRIFGDKTDHNKVEKCITEEDKEIEAKSKATKKDVTVDKLKLNAAKLVNWKSPGTDQVQNVWNI